MGTKIRCALLALALALVSVLCANAQLLPQVTSPPAKPAAPKPAQIVIQTSPNAQVYLDDVLKGQASPQGRLVIERAKPGDHALRVSLAKKRNYELKVTVIAGQGTNVTAVLAEPAGTVVVRTSPGAEVFLDKASRGTTDASGKLAIPEVAAGSHELRISARGKKDFRQSITVPVGQEARVQALLAGLEPTMGDAKVNPKDGLKYMWIPPGSFQMGCSPGDTECNDNEKPAHHVTITKGFWIGQTEVTVGAYKRFAAVTFRKMPSAPGFNLGWASDSMPILEVNWDNADNYCRWAGGRLPTEGEWEYAARGGNSTARYGSLDDVAWYSENSGGQTHPVGEKRPNGFQLYDILGNVSEWVNDRYDEKYYQNSPAQDPAGPASGKLRVIRGLSWDDIRMNVRVSQRQFSDPAGRLSDVGFRCGGEMFAP